MKKLLNITELVEWTNYQLRREDLSQDEKSAFSSSLEHVLFMTKTYEGYGYVNGNIQYVLPKKKRL